jgi:hypothetical protein
MGPDPSSEWAQAKLAAYFIAVLTEGLPNLKQGAHGQAPSEPSELAHHEVEAAK